MLGNRSESYWKLITFGATVENNKTGTKYRISALSGRATRYIRERLDKISKNLGKPLRFSRHSPSPNSVPRSITFSTTWYGIKKSNSR